MLRFLKFIAQYIIIFSVLASLVFSPLFLLFFSSYPVFAADSQSISQDLEKYGIKLFKRLGAKTQMVEMNNKPYLDKSISLDDQLFAIYNGVTHLISDPENFGDISIIPVGTGTNTGGGPMNINQLLTMGKQDYDFRQNKIKNEQDVAKRNAIANELQNAGLRTTGDYFAQAVEARMGGKSVQDILAEQPAINPQNKLPTETFEQWQQRTGVAPPGQQTEVTPTLSVIPSEQSVSVWAGNLIFRIINTSGGIMNWTASVTSGSSWFSIADVTAGVNNGTMSEKTIMVRFLQNNDPSPRTAEITVIALGATGSPKIVTITQAGSAIIPSVPNIPEQKATEQERIRRIEADRQRQEEQMKIDEQIRAQEAAEEALKKAKNNEEQRIAEEARKKAEDAKIVAEQEAQKQQIKDIQTPIPNTSPNNVIQQPLYTPPIPNHNQAKNKGVVADVFTRDLCLNNIHKDVAKLQRFLNAAGFAVAKSGAGSVGRETNFYGPLTDNAVWRFQKNYGIVEQKYFPTGCVGENTRKKLNELITPQTSSFSQPTNNTTYQPNFSVELSNTYLKDGMLFKKESDPKVYLFEGYKKRWIVNEKSFNRKSLQWNKITTISSRQLDAIPEGEQIAEWRDGDLIKKPNDNRVYVLTGITLREVPNNDSKALEAYGYGWDKAYEAPLTLLQNFVESAPLLNATAKQLMNGLNLYKSSGGTQGISPKQITSDQKAALIAEGDRLSSALTDEDDDRLAEETLTEDIIDEAVRAIVTPEVAASLTVGQIPVIGDLYDLVTAVSGYDVIIGEKIQAWERAVYGGIALAALTGAGEPLSGAQVKVAKLTNDSITIGKQAHKMAYVRHAVVNMTSKAINATNISTLKLGNRAIRGQSGKIYSSLRPDVVDYANGIIVEFKSGVKSAETIKEAERQLNEYIQTLNRAWAGTGKTFEGSIEWINENGIIK